MLSLINRRRALATVQKRKILWLTWENQIRNRSISAALGVPLFEVISSRSRMVRYVSCMIRTIVILWRERPSIVICQNPSLALTIFLLGLRKTFNFKVAIDAHFGGVEAFNGSKVFQRMLDKCNRAADLVIVTNEGHARRIRSLRGKVFVCPDPLPDLSGYRDQAEEIPGKVFFICSFDIDEPFLEVFRAAEILYKERFRIFVSGNYRKAKVTPSDFPEVEFLDFVPEPEFYRHLFSSQVVIDLTDHENCLVCGAYEALEAGKPLVLSRKKALQEYFTGGTVFTANQSEEIATAVRLAHAERSGLADECRKWVSRDRVEMKKRSASLRSTLEGL
jgi:glycosyltransferase involved in cell wall biosynthesis